MTRGWSRDGLLSRERCEIVHSMEWMNVGTAEIGPVTCKRVAPCLPCAMRKTLQISYLIPQARPSQFVTVRDLPGTPKGDLHAMGKLIRSMRKRGRPLLWAWVIEPHTYSTSTHAHAWVRFPKPTMPGELTEVWESAATGCGVSVHVKAYTSLGLSDGYGFKKILQWNAPIETCTFEERLHHARGAVSSHLQLNRGRLVHTSRGFWLDDRSEPTTLEALTRGRGGSTRYITYPEDHRGEVVRHLLEERIAQN